MMILTPWQMKALPFGKIKNDFPRVYSDLGKVTTSKQEQ